MISVIIPIYNAEKLLPRCLDSLITQEYQQWEAILVVDGSPDNSKDICEMYAANDSRFKVINKINGGVSSARNSGIEIAEGDWISFVDADDYILPDYLSSMVDSQADLVLCGFTSRYGMNYCPKAQHWNKIEIRDHLIQLMHSEYSIYVPWAKLVRKDIIKRHHIRFNTNLRLSEDTIFVYEYLSYCKSVEFVNTQAYFYDGFPGGAKNKYSLSWDEMVVMYCAQRNVRKKISEAFKYEDDLMTKIDSKFFYVKDIKSQQTLSTCYNRWLLDTGTEFDTSLEYFVNTIVRVGDHFMNDILKENKTQKSDLIQWNNFIDIPVSVVRIRSTFWNFIFKNTLLGHYSLVQFMMKLYLHILKH